MADIKGKEIMDNNCTNFVNVKLVTNNPLEGESNLTSTLGLVFFRPEPLS